VIAVDTNILVYAHRKDSPFYWHDNSVHTFRLGVNYRFGGVPLFIRF
jgi:hypothetical protein